MSSKDSPSDAVSDRADVSIDDKGTPGGVQSFDFSKEDKDLATYASILTVVPIALPLLAFYGYDIAVGLYHEVITFGQTWYVVDGGELEAQLLIPVVNGIVLPSISIVLGTLVSSTLSNLRNRQVAIRECLNREVADMTTLATAVDTIFGRYVEDSDVRTRLLLLLKQYTERLILESRSTATESSATALSAAKTSRNEMDLFQQEIINTQAAHRRQAAVDSQHREGYFDEPFRLMIPTLIMSLNGQRSARLATLLTGYPVQHWIIIGLLYGSVVLCFLEESDGAALQFLGGVQLRGLFTILIGACAAISSLFIDLNDPFRGNFCIKQTTDQLKQLLVTLDAAVMAGSNRRWFDVSPGAPEPAVVGEWLALEPEDDALRVVGDEEGESSITTSVSVGGGSEDQQQMGGGDDNGSVGAASSSELIL
jgi:hypothetical protein